MFSKKKDKYITIQWFKKTSKNIRTLKIEEIRVKATLMIAKSFKSYSRVLQINIYFSNTSSNPAYGLYYHGT